MTLLYHGTDDLSGNTIKGGGVNVSKGGGEFGRGFYLGDNMTLAISWAKGKFPKPAVVKFEIDDTRYASLSFKQLDYKAAKRTWRKLKSSKTTRTHRFGFDVVFGPLVTNSYAAQYKFESAPAQTELNTHAIKSRII